MNKIRLCYVLTPIEFGGLEKVSLTFLQNIDRDRFDIDLVVLIRPWEGEGIFVKKIEKEGYPIFRIPVALYPRNKGEDYFRVLRAFHNLFSFLKQKSFDLVHAHGYFADIIGLPAARLLRIPFISTCHGWISNDIKLKAYDELDFFILHFADKIIAVSENIKKLLIEHGIKERKIEVIYNATGFKIDADVSKKNRLAKRSSLNINNNECVLGYVGRLSPEKGLAYLIEAISILLNSGISLKLLLIGDGSQRNELESIVKKKSLTSSVIFTGFQNDIENWIPAMDIFILPSLTEGSPISILEAMAYGIPVIASAVGGVSELIESWKDGILVMPCKPDEIAKAVIALHVDIVLRNKIAEAGQDKLRLKYDIKNWINRIQSQYLDVIAQHKL